MPLPLVDSALAQIDALEASLHLDAAVRPNDRRQAFALSRVSDAALAVAARIAAAERATFPEHADIGDFVAYVTEMTRLARRVEELATHLRKSLQSHRTQAALRTLSLYAAVKAHARLPEAEAMREHAAALRAEITPKAPVRRVTEAEKAARRAEKSRQRRLAKARAVLAANDVNGAAP